MNSNSDFELMKTVFIEPYTKYSIHGGEDFSLALGPFVKQAQNIFLFGDYAHMYNSITHLSTTIQSIRLASKCCSK